MDDLADFPQRSVHYAKEQFETLLGETENYIREKPAQSLACAFIVGLIANRLPIARLLASVLRLGLFALKPAILIYGATKLYQALQEEE